MNAREGVGAPQKLGERGQTAFFVSCVENEKRGLTPSGDAIGHEVRWFRGWYEEVTQPRLWARSAPRPDCRAR